MTFYVKRPGQHEGTPVGQADGGDFGSSDATLDEWALYLPHQCDAWEIAVGDRETVLADAKKFRAELDHAIGLLEQEMP
jgi:hypothetical protein